MPQVAVKGTPDRAGRGGSLTNGTVVVFASVSMPERQMFSVAPVGDERPA